MKRFKFIGLLLSAVMLFASLSFAGCGFLRDRLDIDAEMQKIIDRIDFDADETFEGKLVIYAESKSTEQAATTAFINSFKEKYPKIEVVLDEFVADSYIDTVKKRHNAAIDSQKYEEMADVFWLANESIPALVNMEMIAPIDYIDLVDDSFTTDALVDSMVRDCKLGDRMYMMPRDYNQFVMFYNKWLLDKCKVDVGDIDTGVALTAEELDDIMYKLHGTMASNAFTTPYGDNTGAGQVLDCNWGWGSMAYGVYRMFGADVANQNGEIIFDSEQSYKAIDWVKKAVINNYTPLPGDQTSGAYFTKYKAPFVIETRAILTDLLDSGANGEKMSDTIGVVPMPILDTEENYAVGAGCSGYAMYQHVTHATEAWLFLKHIVSYEGQQAYGKTGNSVPVLKSLIDDENATWRNPDISLPDDFNHDAFVYNYEKASVMSDYKSKIPTKSVSVVAAQMQSAMINGVKLTGNKDYAQAIKSRIATCAKQMKNEVAKYR